MIEFGVFDVNVLLLCMVLELVDMLFGGVML